MGTPQAPDQSLLSDARALIAELDALGDPADAAFLQGYFKTGPGEYGEGDVFIGVRMPVIRATVKPYRDMPLQDVERVLASPIHEHRMAALIICVNKAKAAGKDLAARKELYEFYLAHTEHINNWDLVDVTCRDVVGEYLLAIDDARPLKKLARSKLIWERRIGIISTAAFIRAGVLEPTFEIADMLIGDKHDLMHKATGWMLREAGKKDEAALEDFLSKHAHELPRTALRYSIERMTPARRKHWLAYAG